MDEIKVVQPYTCHLDYNLNISLFKNFINILMKLYMKKMKNSLKIFNLLQLRFQGGYLQQPSLYRILFLFVPYHILRTSFYIAFLYVEMAIYLKLKNKLPTI